MCREREREFFPDKQWSGKERRAGFVHIRTGTLRAQFHRHQSVCYIDYRGRVDGPLMQQIGSSVAALAMGSPYVINFSNCTVHFPSPTNPDLSVMAAVVGVYIVNASQYIDAIEFARQLCERKFWRVVYLKSQKAEALAFARAQAELLRSIGTQPPAERSALARQLYRTAEPASAPLLSTPSAQRSA